MKISLLYHKNKFIRFMAVEVKNNENTHFHPVTVEECEMLNIIIDDDNYLQACSDTLLEVTIRDLKKDYEELGYSTKKIKILQLNTATNTLLDDLVSDDHQRSFQAIKELAFLNQLLGINSQNYLGIKLFKK